MKDYILIITLHADPAMPPGYNEWGGTHTYMRELLDECERTGTCCIMVTRKSMRQLPDIENYGNFCVIYRITSGLPEPMAKTKLKDYHKTHLSQIMEIIAKQETPPKILHSVYWNSGRLAVELSEYLDISFVHSVISNSRGRVKRGAKEPLPERAEYEQNVYDKAAQLICVSDDERNDLIGLYSVSEEKIVVAGQYIHPAFLTPARDPNNFPRLNSHLTARAQEEIARTYSNNFETACIDNYWAIKMFTYIGRMDFSKGLEHIFAAWYQLYRRYKAVCPSLWLVGGSLPEIERIRKSIHSVIPELCHLEECGKIIWWGYLDAEGLSTVLLKTCALITHSLYEPGGRVAIEAMCEGVPVVATPNGFARDSINDWQEGFIVSYGDTDNLARRMEHFVRQPYLSNALGQTARYTSEQVVERWDFFGRHLDCYNASAFRDRSQSKTVQDYFAKRKIDLFPYRNEPYSEELISAFFLQHTKHPLMKSELPTQESYTSDTCKVMSRSGTYFIKRIYTRLAIGPLFNPICRDHYVRRAGKHYHVELSAYHRQESDVLVGHDDLHYLLLLKQLEDVQIETRADLLCCITELVARADTPCEEDANEFCSIMAQPGETLSELEHTLCILSETFREYYFESSGVFSNQICWRVAPHILEYNRHLLSPKQYDALRQSVEFFPLLASPIEASRLRNIDTGAELKHIKRNNGSICMIDLELTTIGPVEYEISSLLVDFAILQKEAPYQYWNWTFQAFSSVSGIDVQEVLSNAAYRLFYEAIIASVLFSPKHARTYIDQLTTLTNLLRELT